MSEDASRFVCGHGELANAVAIESSDADSGDLKDVDRVWTEWDTNSSFNTIYSLDLRCLRVRHVFSRCMGRVRIFKTMFDSIFHIVVFFKA